MSLKTVLVEIEDTALDALKAAGHVITSFLISEGQKLVAEAKETPVGALAMNIISALESHAATGEQKMASLVGAVVPALTALQAGGGLKGLATSVEDFAKEFAQSAFNDFRAAAAPLALKAGQAIETAPGA